MNLTNSPRYLYTTMINYVIKCTDRTSSNVLRYVHPIKVRAL